MAKLIADSGATKCEWALIDNGSSSGYFSTGISPYFLSEAQITELINKDLIPHITSKNITDVFFYGTGLGNPNNVNTIEAALKNVFVNANLVIETDMHGAAKSLCGNDKGLACILGTGSNACYFNGETIEESRPGLGFILGDEGSGSYLGKKVVQYFLYNTFDDDLMHRFNETFATNKVEILERVYKGASPNKYLAQFTIFLAENRGHFMVENIIEDGLNDFFQNHLLKFSQSTTLPINFTGSVAFGFKDVLQELCNTYELVLGNVSKNPMDGLIQYHK